MYLSQLKLQRYRNYEQISLSFENGIHIFCGQNAQGKTNVLESMYVLALVKSHRTHRDKELISWAGEFASIQGKVERKYGSMNLEIQFTQSGKKAKINGMEQKKLSDYIGGLNVVMFAPEDLNIVKGSPSHRRRFIDMEIGQISPHYLYNLVQYNKVLSQRNNVLKELQKHRNDQSQMLDIWDEQLIQYGVKVMKKRAQFISKLEVWAGQIHSNITQNKETLKIVYSSSIGTDPLQKNEEELADLFRMKCAKLKQQEISRGTTLIGPHRDDLEFYINDIEVQTYGSQGQQRTCALSVKLAEIELIHQEVGEYPILLLDDVLSELDQFRQTHLLKTIENKVQTFVTTTSIDGISEETIKNSYLYEVEEGTIIPNRGE